MSGRRKRTKKMTTFRPLELEEDQVAADSVQTRRQIKDHWHIRMLSISSRSASASGIRAYLEGERDGANRRPEDYYAESGQARGVWLGSGAAELHLSGAVTEHAFDTLAAGLHPESGEPPGAACRRAPPPGVGLALLGAEIGLGLVADRGAQAARGDRARTHPHGDPHARFCRGSESFYHPPWSRWNRARACASDQPLVNRMIPSVRGGERMPTLPLSSRAY